MLETLVTLKHEHGELTILGLGGFVKGDDDKREEGCHGGHVVCDEQW